MHGSRISADGDDHLVLCRDDVEPLRAIFADDMHRAAAARASSVLRLDDNLDPRQVVGQRAPAGPPLLAACPLRRRIGLLLFGRRRGDRLFEVLQR